MPTPLGPKAESSSGTSIGRGSRLRAEINAPSNFMSDVVLSVPLFGQDRLDINAPTTFRGGSYGGAGALAINHTAVIHSDTSRVLGVGS